jgi:phosphoserine aminotransferase
MISFYPGPSRVHDEIPQYVKDAFDKGVMSINHRSEEFITISQKTIGLLKEKLNIPNDYTIFYTSSATECWEIIAQSIITKKSFHLYNGAFGEKWFEYTKRLRAGAKNYKFDQEQLIDPKKYNFGTDEGVICITQNETSNGTQVSNEIIRSLKENNPTHLIAVDATSSLAGVNLDFNAADIWFASVQKCFGLPAGLGLMICSPATLNRVKNIDEKNHYNSLTFMAAMMEKWQTPFTPNVLNIYLLMRVMESVNSINEVEAELKNRYQSWISFFEIHPEFSVLVKNKQCHSYTVLALTGRPEILSSLKTSAKKSGLLLGEGYGEHKNSTFRIANFPALKGNEISKLKHFLKVFVA